MFRKELEKTFYLIPLFFFGNLIGMLIKHDSITLKNIVLLFILSYFIWFFCGLSALGINSLFDYFAKKQSRE